MTLSEDSIGRPFWLPLEDVQVQTLALTKHNWHLVQIINIPCLMLFHPFVNDFTSF